MWTRYRTTAITAGPAASKLAAGINPLVGRNMDHSANCAAAAQWKVTFSSRMALATLRFSSLHGPCSSLRRLS